MAVSDRRLEDERQMLADLYQHPGFAVLKERVRKIKQEYFEALAADLYGNPEKIREADLTAKQQYFKGIARILNEPYFEARHVTQDLARKEAAT